METLDSMDLHLFQFGWMIYLFWDRPWESFAGLGILAVGMILFLFDKRIQP